MSGFEILESDSFAITSSVRQAASLASKGKNVLLYLTDEDNPNSIEGYYCTDFWCYPMFKSISESMNKPLPVGTLGLSIDTKSPALKDFPSESFSEPNWYEIVMASRSTILNNTGISPIVATIDNASRSHLLGMIYEIKIEGTDGNILVCTSDLPKLISFNKNEAYALNNSLLTYLKDQNAAHCPATISLQNYYKLFGLS